jgi:hypothetical protein
MIKRLYLIFFPLLVSCCSSQKAPEAYSSNNTGYSNYSAPSYTPPPPPPKRPPSNQCYDVDSTVANNVSSQLLKGKRFAIFDSNSGQKKPLGPFFFNTVTFTNSSYPNYFNTLINGQAYDLETIYVESSTSYFESLARKIGCDRSNTVTAVKLLY